MLIQTVKCSIWNVNDTLYWSVLWALCWNLLIIHRCSLSWQRQSPLSNISFQLFPQTTERHRLQLQNTWTSTQSAQLGDEREVAWVHTWPEKMSLHIHQQMLLHQVFKLAQARAAVQLTCLLSLPEVWCNNHQLLVHDEWNSSLCLCL